MKRDRRFLGALGLLGCMLALVLCAAGGLVVASLDEAQREQLHELIGDRLPLAFMAWATVLALAVPPLRALHDWLFGAPARLAEAGRALVETGAAPLSPDHGSAETRELARVLAGLAAQRDSLRAGIDEQVRAGIRQLEHERGRLAALMSELAQSVIVCNLDGRILLYNRRARLQFRALSDAPDGLGGSELLGLGRSIYPVLDRPLVAHALDTVRSRVRAGDEHPGTQFVTAAPGGQLLRVQMAAVPAGDDGAETDLAGFVLVVDNITRDYDEDCARDRRLLDFDDACRATLAGMQGALDQLARHGDDVSARDRQVALVRDGIAALDSRLRALSDTALRSVKTRWPLEDMRGADLVAAAVRRIAAPRLQPEQVDAALWLRVDSFALLQALEWLARRLADEYEVRVLSLSLQAEPGGAQARLDLAWQGRSMSTDTVMNWQMEAMNSGDGRTPLSIRDVVERHGGQFGVERERASHRTRFRFLLPLAGAPAPVPASRITGRPEFYDFDLFRTGDPRGALAEQPLTELAYTVFDTETTGLDPSGGDEIIQIGATRIVNGRLLRSESFEQCVAPQRPVPAASTAIHGLRAEDLHGQPRIEAVLPAFHAFARDTVLVAHNAAFDMRFLELKQASSGVCFDQPVLDTLLLSALVQPGQTSHRLEDIAARFGIAVSGRHTALGDALVTAEIFQKLLPLLAARGIRTLGDALAAARNTYHARIAY
jgi:DNA polymerase-3 subunit epsilon